MCYWFAGWQLWQFQWTCSATGGAVWAAAIFAGLIVLLSLYWMVLGTNDLRVRLAGLLSLLAVFLLSIAAGMPALLPVGDAPTGGRIVVLLDGSESIRRTGSGDIEAAREFIAQQTLGLAQEIPDGADWRGSVHAFGAVARRLSPEVELRDLGSSVLGGELGAMSQDTNLEAAIETALQDIAQGPGAGQIILLSDGLQTLGDVSSAVDSAQQAGVAIHTLAVGSDRPAQGLLSLNLGPDQFVGREAVVRATVQGDGRLTWGVNGAVDPAQPEILGSDPTAVRIPLIFGERGLNFVTVGFEHDARLSRSELLYTLVRGPARVLVFGAAPWVDRADPAMFLIDRAAPNDPIDFAGYDAIVIDALDPSQFAADMPERLLAAAASGAGLFIVNGPLRGSIEDMQRLSDWENTAIGPVLPVNSDPAQYIAEPPKRDILIIIDTSGSMGNANYMQLARAAASKVLDSLRPQDSITILPFSTDALRPFRSSTSGPDTIADARQFIGRLSVAGGTSMDRALAEARSLRGNNCALFIIGDGGYEAAQIQVSPICPTTAIGVANQLLPGIDTSWGQGIRISSIGQLGAITYEAFAPEPRTTFWADGPFTTLPVRTPSDFAMTPSVFGAALSYPRPESHDIVVMADSPRAPVLAFRQDPKVRSLRTGVFLGVVPSGLTDGVQGWASEVLKELIGWDDTGLFDITFQLRDDEVNLRLVFVGDGPVPTNVGASILLPDGGSSGIALRPDGRFGVFEGVGRVSLSNTPARAILNVELGGDNVQSIPLRLPARGAAQGQGASVREGFGFGVDYDVLNDIRMATGGIDLMRSSPSILRAVAVPRQIPIWPFLAGSAILIFAASLFLGGVRR
jgi:hypothetical protein